MQTNSRYFNTMEDWRIVPDPTNLDDTMGGGPSSGLSDSTDDIATALVNGVEDDICNTIESAKRELYALSYVVAIQCRGFKWFDKCDIQRVHYKILCDICARNRPALEAFTTMNFMEIRFGTGPWRDIVETTDSDTLGRFRQIENLAKDKLYTGAIPHLVEITTVAKVEEIRKSWDSLCNVFNIDNGCDSIPMEVETIRIQDDSDDDSDDDSSDYSDESAPILRRSRLRN